jgi:hypothetical protein
MRTDVPVAGLSWVLEDAIAVIDVAATDRIAVCDGGTFVGVITAADLVELGEVLDLTGRRPGADGEPGTKTAVNKGGTPAS